MVDQFADSYAYLRELVQNGIDAGARSIQVRVTRESDGRVHTSVEDDGSGMSRTTLEGPLLTLFSSSKENDRTRIGKYGIGFVSVLASKPIHVEVHTSKSDASWLLRLFGDHSYELEAATPRAQSGTRVALLHTMSREELLAHQARVHDTLTRWCRHARVPITLRCLDHDAPGEGSCVEIHEELEIAGIETVTWEDGDTRIVVSVRTAAEPSFVGYYNHGLTLLESERTEPEIDGLWVKIDSPDLAHTLSRDDVRRDRTQRKLVARARKLGETTLRERLLERLLDAAVAADVRSMGELLDALGRPFFGTLAEATVALVEPLQSRTTITLADLARSARQGVFVADESSMKSRVLARTGIPVVRGSSLASVLRNALPPGLVVSPIPDGLDVVEAELERPGDSRLLDALRRLLQAAGHSASRVILARFSRRAARSWLVSTSKDHAVVVAPFFGPTGSAPLTLFLDTLDPDVANARQLATRSPELAAHWLCRLLLLDQGPLLAPAVDALLAAARVEQERP